MKKRENAGISIMAKIAGLSSAFVLIAALAIVSISSMYSMSRKTALIMAGNKIRGTLFLSNIFLTMNTAFCRLLTGN